MLFAGRLISLYGGRRVLSVFSLALIPVLPMVVFSPNLWALAVFMAVFGAMAGCMDVAMNAQAVEIERRLHKAIMSSSHGFWSLGGFIGGSAGAWVIAHWGSEVQSLLTAGIVAVVVLVAMQFLLPEVPHAPQAEATPKPKTQLFPKDFHVWLLGFLALFSMVPEGAVLDWAAIYLQKELGSDVFVSGLCLLRRRDGGDALSGRHGAQPAWRGQDAADLGADGGCGAYGRSAGTP